VFGAGRRVGCAWLSEGQKGLIRALRPVSDFGLHPDEVTARDARQPRTEDQLGAAIVSEAELRLLGRWGGLPPPARRTRF